MMVSYINVFHYLYYYLKYYVEVFRDHVLASGVVGTWYLTFCFAERLGWRYLVSRPSYKVTLSVWFYLGTLLLYRQNMYSRNIFSLHLLPVLMLLFFIFLAMQLQVLCVIGWRRPGLRGIPLAVFPILRFVPYARQVCRAYTSRGGLLRRYFSTWYKTPGQCSVGMQVSFLMFVDVAS